jgi:epoxyqueuosine reductase
MKSRIEAAIAAFVESPENTLADRAGERAWDRPSVGFSRGDDPIFQDFKEHIGSFYWTPLEAFEVAFPDSHPEAGGLTVISWILPQTKATREDNRAETRYPSERWARSRKYGEEFNARLRLYLVKALQDEGYEAVSPVDLPSWSREVSERFGFASRWSERHAAHASGLGTFGLCDGLITPVGKAMRCGSVVAGLRVEPSERPYEGHHDYCLFFSEGTCGKCIDRCPAGALSKEGHDKERCSTYLRTVTASYAQQTFGFEVYGCGLCQTKVPCEAGIPPQKRIRDTREKLQTGAKA